MYYQFCALINKHSHHYLFKISEKSVKTGHIPAYMCYSESYLGKICFDCILPFSSINVCVFAFIIHV